MSDQQQPQTTIGVAGKVGTALIASLPAPFLGLCVVNLVFIVAVLWFLDRQRADRMIVFTRVLDACIEKLEDRPRQSLIPRHHEGGDS